ncbi:protein MICROTUBULE BINDING PROTEIN 2C [Cynara cardunculus var. scolymus]|uniref:protein MICROTUBULE BINDING PROTEIN 2C n=1 Tax=Cynara cardunculus var. scolymus TaxID=59895 RepID=UPI000D62F18F|nr:protein MICROTUBULE BINDING PROTEIN 2C [Cynara cardunculus var. scolymus]
MYHQSSQHFDLEQDNATLGFGGGEPTSWLSGEDLRPSSPSHRRNLSAFSSSTATTAAGNVDRLLFNDLVQIVPLVQSLIDRKANTSYTRRGSMIYTKTPSRESLANKMTEAKGRNAQSIPGKKRRDNGGNEQDGGADGFSMFSSSSVLTKEREELAELREKVVDLERQLLEKDEILKSTEASKDKINSVNSMLDEVKKQALEKDVLLRSTQAQLADVKIKLADKQAAVEKLQWEAMTSNRKAEKLQEDLNAIQGEMSSYKVLFEGLSSDNFNLSDQEYDVIPHVGHLPEIDDLDELDMSKMEEAKEAYMAAIAAAKEKQDEESITVAANARLHLQSFVLRV